MPPDPVTAALAAPLPRLAPTLPTRLGHLLSCAMDLRPYVAALPPPDAAWLSSALSERLAALASAAEDEAAASAATDGRPSREALSLLRHRVCALQLQEELLGGSLRPGAPQPQPPQLQQQQQQPAGKGDARAGGVGGCPHLRRALDLVEVFRDALPLAKGLDERERGPADELLPMAAAALMRAASEAATGGGRACVVAAALRAVAVLEAGACVRPFSGDLRLGLGALYGLLGCAGLAAGHFGKTEAKHIQMDTLASHHLLPIALGLGADKVRGPEVLCFGGRMGGGFRPG
jgi:N-terminal acetyltransferase B complex non-catalytic subunit